MQPYFYSFQEFLAMGKHGPYVWSSWGLTFIFIIGVVVYSIMQRRQLLKELNMQQTRQDQRHRNQRHKSQNNHNKR